jgi:hypothetical protein
MRIILLPRENFQMFYRVTVMLQTQSRVVKTTSSRRPPNRKAIRPGSGGRSKNKDKNRRVATESINTLQEKERRIPRSKQITSNAQLIVV